MAKSGEPNIFLQHIEKIVLGLCAIILMVAVLQFAISAPTVEMSDEAIVPEQLDPGLLSKAKAIIESGRQPEPLEPIQDYPGQLHKLLDAQMPQMAMYMADWGPPALAIYVGPVDPKAKSVKVADLEQVAPAPQKPLVKAVAELRNSEKDPDVLAAHLTAVYPYAKLGQEWAAVLKQSVVPATLILMDVQAEVQEQLPSGEWGQPRIIDPVARSYAQASSGSRQIVIPEFDGTNLQIVQNAISQYRQQGYEMAKAQPDYWDLYIMNQWLSWRVNLPVIEEMRTLAETEGAQPTPAPRSGGTSGAGSVPMPMPMPSYDPGMMGPMGPMGSSSSMGPMGPVGPAMPAAPKKKPVPGTPVAPLKPGEQLMPQPTAVPTWSALMSAGKLQVWLHDDSLESLKLYRYRLRLVMLSPLFTQSAAVDPAEDAKRMLIETPWSDWSDPVAAPRETSMFVTGSSEQQKMVGITVFARCQGQRVKHSFNVRVGEKIGQEADVEVADLNQPANKVRMKVNFATGATLIAVEWNRSIVRNTIKMQTAEIIYLDEQGKLQSRLMEIDRDSKEFKDLEAEVRRPVAQRVTVPKPERPRTGRTPGNPGGNPGSSGYPR